MKFASFACGASLMLAMASVSFGQNLVSDPSFEGVNASAGDVAMSTAGVWSGWNNWVSPYSGYYTAGVPAHSGSQAAKTFSGPNAGIYQNVAVTGGQSYVASAYFMDSSTDYVSDANATEDVRLTFFSGPNATGTNLGAQIAPVVLSPAASAADTWNLVVDPVTAPATAESAQWLAFFNNPDYAGGSMFVDDASLVAVPEPASFGLLAIGGLAALRRKR